MSFERFILMIPFHMGLAADEDVGGIESKNFSGK